MQTLKRTPLTSQCSKAVLLIEERAKLVIFTLKVKLKKIFNATSAESQNRKMVLHSRMCTMHAKNYTTQKKTLHVIYPRADI